ncbi:MAG: DUF2163 domain-containing protein [Candidatus Accumulibacter phosphatis]
MKPAVADARYRVLCLRIVPVTGSPILLTDHPRDLVMSAQTYLSTSGYQFTGYSDTADFAPASIDIEGIVGLAGVTRAAIANGLFDGARVYVFATSWAAPVEDQEEIVAGEFGKATLLDDRYQIGGVSLIDALGQRVGRTYGAQCDKTFCSQEFGGCMASLAANTVTGTLTAVSSASVFTDSGRAEAADTFGAGTIQFTSGPNAGLKPLEVKSFSAGVFQTVEPFYSLPAVGNTYSAVRGCRKTLAACQARVGGSNVINFGGYTHIPTSSTYTTIGQGG